MEFFPTAHGRMTRNSDRLPAASRLAGDERLGFGAEGCSLDRKLIFVLRDLVLRFGKAMGLRVYLLKGQCLFESG